MRSYKFFRRLLIFLLVLGGIAAIFDRWIIPRAIRSALDKAIEGIEDCSIHAGAISTNFFSQTAKASDVRLFCRSTQEDEIQISEIELGIGNLWPRTARIDIRSIDLSGLKLRWGDKYQGLTLLLEHFTKPQKANSSPVNVSVRNIRIEGEHGDASVQLNYGGIHYQFYEPNVDLSKTGAETYTLHATAKNAELVRDGGQSVALGKFDVSAKLREGSVEIVRGKIGEVESSNYIVVEPLSDKKLAKTQFKISENLIRLIGGFAADKEIAVDHINFAGTGSRFILDPQLEGKVGIDLKDSVPSVSGDVAIKGTEPEFTANLQMVQTVFSKVSLGPTSLKAKGVGQQISLEVTSALNSQPVSGTLQSDPSGKLKGSIHVPNFALAQADGLFKPLLFFGDDLAADLTVGGDLSRPTLTGQVTQTSGSRLDLKYDENGVAQLAGPLLGDALFLDLRSVGNGNAKLKLEARNLQAPRFAYGASKIGVELPNLGGSMSGVLEVTGPIADLPFGNGSLKIASFDVIRGSGQLQSDGELSVELTPTLAKIKRAVFKTNRTTFGVTGSMALSGALNLNLAGDVTLKALVGELPGIEEIDGDISLGVAVTGTAMDPKVNGKLALQNGKLIFPMGGTVVGFTSTKADISITGDNLRTSNITADFAGAHVTGEGHIDHVWEESAKASGGLKLSFDDVISEPSPGLTVTMNGDIGLRKVPNEEYTVYGDIKLGRSGYVSTTSLASFLRGLQELLVPERFAGEATTDSKEGVGPRLALKLSTATPFTVDTSVVKGEVVGTVDINGYFNHPLVFGTVKSSNGEFSLGKKKFAFYTAEATFDGKPGINPLLRFVADTEIRGRDGEPSQAQLIISGRLDSPQVKVLSNSGLSENEIVAQLTASGSVNLFGDSGDNRTETKLFGVVGVSTPLSVGQKLSEFIGLKDVQVGNALTVNGETVPEVTAIRPLKAPFSLHFRSQFSRDQESAVNLLYAISPDTNFLAGVRTNTPSRQAAVGSESAEVGFQRKRYFGGFGLLGWLDPTSPDVKISGSTADEPLEPGTMIKRVLLQSEDSPPELSHKVKEELERFVDRPYTKAVLHEAKLKVLSIVRAEGYLQASIEDERPNKGSPETAVFSLTLRKKFTISFEGNQILSSEDLLEPLKLETRLVPISSGSLLSLQSDIRSLYQRLGFFNVRVRAEELEHDSDGARHFVLHIDEGKPVSVVAVNLEGNYHIETSELTEMLGVAPRGGWLLRAWYPGRVTDAMLEQDTATIRQYYLDRGYFEVKVLAEVMPVEQSSSEVNVTYSIEEGERTKIASIELKYQGDLNIRERIKEILDSIAVGDDFDLAAIEKAKSEVAATIKDLFAFYNSEIGHEFIKSERRLIWYVHTGNPIMIDNIELTGNKHVDTELLQRELEFKEGEQLTDKKIEQSIQNLFESGLVSSVKIEPKDGKWENSSEDLKVEVKEREGGTASSSITVNSEDGLHLAGDITQRNLFATGNTIRFRADTYMKDFSSIIDAGNLGVSLAVPHFDGHQGKLTIDLFADYAILLIDPYSYDKLGSRINYDLPLGSKSRLRFSINEYSERLFDVPEDIIISDKDTGHNSFGGLGMELDLDSRNDRFNPSKGNHFIAATNVYNGLMGSTVDFAQFSVRNGMYVPQTRRTFWYLGAGAKIAEPFASSDSIPLSQRYFLGGRDSLRGFSRNAVGPRGSLGNVGGGDTAMQASAEYHYRLTESFESLLFVDVGQSYLRNKGDFEGDNKDFDSPRYSPGIGFRFGTPVGPLGIEYGVNPEQMNGERPGRLYFGLGGTF